MSGGAGVNRFAIATGDSGNIGTGVIDVITDWKAFAGTAATSDSITGTAFTTLAVGITGNLATSANYGAALVLANAADEGTFRAAVGTGTSFTLFLFESSGAGANTTTAAVQLGATGQFGTDALALAGINTAQVVA